MQRSHITTLATAGLMLAVVARLVGAQVPLAEPQMAGPLIANPQPASVDAGPLGPIYVTGALSGLGLMQTHPAPGDRSGHLDVANAQVLIQNTEALARFYVQAGIYSIPVVGPPSLRPARNTSPWKMPLPTR